MRWAIVALALLGEASYAGYADLSWRAPEFNTDGTPLTDLAGYTIYAGCFESGSYELQPVDIDDPAITTYRYEGLPDGETCWFVSTALNEQGVESAHSNEAQKLIPAAGEPPGKPQITFTWSESDDVITVPWTSQPPPGTRLNPSHPLYENLATAWVPGNGLVDLAPSGIDDVLGAHNGALSMGGSPSGFGIRPTSYNTTGVVAIPDRLRDPIVIDETRPFTIVVSAYQYGAKFGGNTPALMQVGRGTTNGRWWIGNLDNTSNRLRFSTDGDASFGGTTFTSGVEWPNTGQAKLQFVIRYDGTNLALWQNGRFVGSQTANIDPLNQGDGGYNLRFGGHESTETGFNGVISFFSFSAIATDDELCRSMSANPWQIFEPQVLQTFVPAGGGGSNREITVALATLAAAEQAAAINASRNVDATLVSLDAASLAATVGKDRSLTLPLATLTLAMQNATIDRERGVATTLASLSVTPFAASVVLGGALEVSVALAQLSATTQAATANLTRNLDVALATLTTTPNAATINKTREVVVALAELGISTFNATVSGPDAGEQLVIAARRGLVRLIHRR